MKRKGYGTSGKQLDVYTNSFVITIPEDMIYHYDGEYVSHISPVKMVI